MSNNIGKFIFFAAGLVVGSVVTWKLTKVKYERIAQEEIDSVKAVYSRKAMKLEKTPENLQVVTLDYCQDYYNGEYATLKSKYDKAFDTNNNEEEGDAEESDGPYVITPDEFDENGYETVSLTYFADKVLVDDEWEVVTDLDGTIGRDSLNRFGEYEDDSVFVRNDELRIDYEILYDPRNWSDVHANFLLETASLYP